MSILILYLPVSHVEPEAKLGELIGCQGWEPVGLERKLSAYYLHYYRTEVFLKPWIIPVKIWESKYF